MAYIDPVEPANRQLNVLITRTMERELAWLREIMDAASRARYPDDETASKAKDKARVSLADLVRRLLRIGIDGSFAELGARPMSEEEKDQLIAAVVARIIKSNK